LQKVVLREDLMAFVTKVSDLKKWFKGYKIETIELNIEGAIKDGNITKLFVSFEGKGGCKITLKQNKRQQLILKEIALKSTFSNIYIYFIFLYINLFFYILKSS
jgi:hypothetical protein